MWILFDTEHNSRSGAGRRIEKVRIDEETLSERIEEWHLSGYASKWKSKGTSAHGAGTGRITV